MENKVLVYAVLAISLGYLLVSAVPSQLAPQMFSESEDSKRLKAPWQERGEAPAEGTIPPAPEPDETFSDDVAEAQGDIITSEDSALAAAEPGGTFSGDATSAQSDASAAEAGSGSLVISVFGTWSVNLVIALGVYFIARRRFS